ncbi:MAG: hypothetical protein ACREOK_04935 [Gemmatimonadaceae bacterium]
MTAVLLAALATSPGVAQESRDAGRAGKRSVMPRDLEIALARSAAPVSVSDSAEIWVFTDTGYVVAVPGTNGNACYVSRSWARSIEPHCFDAEGAATILRVHMREVELLHRGMTPDEAERLIAPEIVSGRLRLPSRPAMSYMMSAEQSLISDDGRPVGRWRPHVMIYYPFLRSDGRAPDMRAAMLTAAGTAQSSFTIVVPEFVQSRP